MFATNCKLAWSVPLPQATGGCIPGRFCWAGHLSVCPGFPVLGVFLALLQPQRGSSFRFSQGCEGGQVGSRAGEVPAPPVLRPLQPQAGAAAPRRARRPPHPARLHQQSIARVTPEILLPSDGAVVLTWEKGIQGVTGCSGMGGMINPTPFHLPLVSGCSEPRPTRHFPTASLGTLCNPHRKDFFPSKWVLCCVNRCYCTQKKEAREKC